jgi:LDH2 family malate/lactate/ureidoglycolate dehydrogenase
MSDKMTIVPADVLFSFARGVFVKLGVQKEDADIACNVLIQADLRGINSHGIARLKRYYEGLKRGFIKPGAEIKILRETPVTATLDGGSGLGQVVSVRSMELAIKKAQESYVGFVAVRNTNHFGIAGYYAMMALKEDMIGICTTNSEVCVVPTFGTQAMLGTNPISIAIPTSKEPPFVLDMATSTVPVGKLEVYSRIRKPIPEGWAVDESGEPAADPAQVITNIYGHKGGGLLPLGGSEEEFGGHKGYGLALAVEVFSALLSGALYSDLVYPVDSQGNPLSPNIGHFFGAMRLDAFRDPEEFKRDMADLIGRLKNSPKRKGQERIYVHGEKEWEMHQRRKIEGIPLVDKVVRDLKTIACDLELGLPF